MTKVDAAEAALAAAKAAAAAKQAEKAAAKQEAETKLRAAIAGTDEQKIERLLREAHPLGCSPELLQEGVLRLSALEAKKAEAKAAEEKALADQAAAEAAAASGPKVHCAYSRDDSNQLLPRAPVPTCCVYRR